MQASIGPRSYNILLTERAIQAMEQAGAQLEGYDVVELAASMRHAQKGGPADGRSTRFPGRFKLASRGALAGALVQSCQAQHADRVTFHFGQELSRVDAASSTTSFRAVGGGAAAEGAPITFDLIVGADGASSALRQALQRQDPELQVGWVAGGACACLLLPLLGGGGAVASMLALPCSWPRETRWASDCRCTAGEPGA